MAGQTLAGARLRSPQLVCFSFTSVNTDVKLDIEEDFLYYFLEEKKVLYQRLPWTNGY